MDRYRVKLAVFVAPGILVVLVTSPIQAAHLLSSIGTALEIQLEDIPWFHTSAVQLLFSRCHPFIYEIEVAADVAISSLVVWEMGKTLVGVGMGVLE